MPLTAKISALTYLGNTVKLFWITFKITNIVWNDALCSLKMKWTKIYKLVSKLCLSRLFCFSVASACLEAGFLVASWGHSMARFDVLWTWGVIAHGLCDFFFWPLPRGASNNPKNKTTKCNNEQPKNIYQHSFRWRVFISRALTVRHYKKH